MNCSTSMVTRLWNLTMIYSGVFSGLFVYLFRSTSVITQRCGYVRVKNIVKLETGPVEYGGHRSV